MRDTIKKQLDAVREAEREYAAAFGKAKETIESRKAKIREAARAQQQILAELRAKRAKANDDRGEAIINTDKAKEAELDDLIKKYDQQIAETEQKIEAIGNRSTSATERDAVLLAVSFYRDFSEVCNEQAESLRELGEKIVKQIEELEAVRKLTEHTVSDLNSKRGNTPKADSLIQLYESIFGEIDIAGHTCGTDKEAKFRFIIGSPRGLEKTEAGKLLAKEK